MTSAKLDAVGQHWIAALANYNFQLHYKAGKTNVEADALSQIPWQKPRSECQDLDCLTVKAIIMGCTTKPPLIDVYVVKTVIPSQKDTLFCGKVVIDPNPPITNQEWREWQNQDKTIAESKKLSQQKGHNNDSEEVKTMLRH